MPMHFVSCSKVIGTPEHVTLSSDLQKDLTKWYTNDGLVDLVIHLKKYGTLEKFSHIPTHDGILSCWESAIAGQQRIG